MDKVKILNTSIDNLSLSELLASLEQGVVFTPNVDHLIKLQRDRQFFTAYCAADYRICDSKILFYTLRLLGFPIRQKISGSDFFPAFYQYHQHNQAIKIFLLGGDKGVAAAAQERINAKVGRAIVVGTYAPSFGFERNPDECQQMITAINQSGATVLAVGLGAPKQEKFIYQYKSQLRQIKIFLALGATLNFESGKIKRAPQWLSEIGLEWLYRLVSEPSRLWQRYLLDDPTFFWFILLQLLNCYRNPFSTSSNSDSSLDITSDIISCTAKILDQ